MNNEVRKPPREFTLIAHYSTDHDMCLWGISSDSDVKTDIANNGKKIVVREVLPGDDSLRVSHVLTADLQMILSHVDIQKMSESDEVTYWQLKERIERESKGEG